MKGKKKLSIKKAAFEDIFKRRFIIAPSFSIYGGIAGLYDYGPPGCSIKNNLLQFWRRHFVLEEGMYEIECSSVTPSIVLETSGHVEKFQDFMVRDVVTKNCFRADHLLEEQIDKLLLDPANESRKDELLTIRAQSDNYSCEELGQKLKELKAKAPETGNEITDPFPFNLMFKTSIGPTGLVEGFLRPETAQGIFLNFSRLLEANGGRLPFAGCQVGPAFRNEIAPRSGVLRVREFTLAEIEHFVNPEDKSHPKFKDVAHIEITLFPRENQTGSKKCVRMPIGKAVEKKSWTMKPWGTLLFVRIFL